MGIPRCSLIIHLQRQDMFLKASEGGDVTEMGT